MGAYDLQTVGIIQNKIIRLIIRTQNAAKPHFVFVHVKPPNL